MGTVLLGAAAALFCSVSLDVTPLVTCSIDRRLEMMPTAASIGSVQSCAHDFLFDH